MSNSVTIIPPLQWSYVFTCKKCGDHNWHCAPIGETSKCSWVYDAILICSHCLTPIQDKEQIDKIERKD